MPRRARLGVLRQDHFRYEARSHPRRGDDGPHGALGGDGREGAHPGPRRGALRRRSLRGARGHHPPAGRLHARSPRGRNPGGARHSDRGPRAAALDALGGLQAACAAGPGAGVGARCAAARRAHQSPGHPLDPLARALSRELQGRRADGLPRPSLSRQHRHGDRRRRLRDDHRLPRQLPGIHARQARRSRAPREGNREARGPDRRAQGISSSASAPRPPRRARRRASSRSIARIEVEELPQSSRRYPRFRFQQCRPSGRQVLAIDGVAKSYGDNRVLDFRFAHDHEGRTRGDHRAERHRQVDAAQGGDGRGCGGRGHGVLGVRDAPRLRRAGPQASSSATRVRRSKRGSAAPARPSRSASCAATWAPYCSRGTMPRRSSER